MQFYGVCGYALSDVAQSSQEKLDKGIDDKMYKKFLEFMALQAMENAENETNV